METNKNKAKKNGIHVDFGHILIAILVGFCILATVGLIAGFTRRSCPNKVVQPTPAPTPLSSTILPTTSPTTPSTTSPTLTPTLSSETTSQQPSASVSNTSTTSKCSLYLSS